MADDVADGAVAQMTPLGFGSGHNLLRQRSLSQTGDPMMKCDCPGNGSHVGYLPLFVTVMQVHPAWPPLKFSRFRLCGHDIHVRNFEALFARRSDCSAERGRAWVWLRCEDRKALVKVPSQHLCVMHVHRVTNAMRWIVNPAGSVIKWTPCRTDDEC